MPHQQQLPNDKNSFNTSSRSNGRSNSHNNNISLPHFSINTLKTATNNFSESNKLGFGTFGVVYKGSYLQTAIAVKWFKLKENQAMQFQAELVSLSRFFVTQTLLAF